MNQIFGFKPRFKQLILDGIKIFTTCEETPFRLKCGVGDFMYMFIGIRTKKAEKFAVARCIERFQWRTELPIGHNQPPSGNNIPLDWNTFARLEGFHNLEELEKFFCKKLITYEFKVIEVNE